MIDDCRELIEQQFSGASEKRAAPNDSKSYEYRLPAGIRIPQRIIERVGVGMLRPRQRAQPRERVYLREAARGGVVPARAQVLYLSYCFFRSRRLSVTKVAAPPH